MQQQDIPLKMKCAILVLFALLASGCSNAAGVLRRTADDGGTHKNNPAVQSDEETHSNMASISDGRPRVGAPHPIVLVHGFSGFHNIGPVNYFFRVVTEFEEEGHQMFAPAQPPYASTENRAAILRDHIDQILDATWNEKVHLICHSQGRLDCRYLVSQLGYAEQVANIITIATPHRGTPLADTALIAPEGMVNAAGLFLGWLLGLGDGAPPEEAAWGNDKDREGESWDAEMRSSAKAMAEATMAEWNAGVPDHPSVPIFSVAAYSNLTSADQHCVDGILYERNARIDPIDVLLIGPGLFISGLNPFDLRRNDGIVPTDSMRWGTFLGCIPADHFDQVGQIADLLPVVLSGFNHLAFYRELVEFLRTKEAHRG